jgi:hypothetical protein
MALALASPGLAADDSVTIQTIAPPPEVTTSAPADETTDSTSPPAPGSELSIPAPAEPEITVDVDADGGDIDVSVRVLSPGEDSPDAVEPPVVSDSTRPDTTTVTTADVAGAATEDPTHGSNTNVSIRVLSPGDNASVDDSSSPETESTESTTGDSTQDPATGAAVADEAPDAAKDSSEAPNNDAQYHARDSRYQSVEEFSEEAWTWIWYLSLDCDGNPSSSSTESGSASAPEWAWDWTWEWACGSPPHPPPVGSLEDAVDGGPLHSTESDSTANEPESPPVSGDGDSPAPATSGAEWLWIWTFTFCGETVSVRLPIDTESAPRWTWEWDWTWNCLAGAAPELSEPIPSPSPPFPSASVPSEPAGEGATPGGDAATADERGTELADPRMAPTQLPTWLISLLHTGLDDLLVVDSGAYGLPAFTSTAADIAPIRIPLLPQLEGGGEGHATATFDAMITSSGVGQHRRATVAGTALDTRNGAVSPTRGAILGRVKPRLSDPRVDKGRTSAEQPATRRRSDAGNPLLPWPPRFPLQAAGAPGASSGFAPSGSVLGTAALVALFVLAAPGFGRRIRVARELRPRGTCGSSIDHPG